MKRKRRPLEVDAWMTLLEKMRERLRYARQQKFAYTLIETDELAAVVKQLQHERKTP